MDNSKYAEMLYNLNEYCDKDALRAGSIFVFGHCEASQVLIDELLKRDLKPVGILDNNEKKLGIEYRGVFVGAPDLVLSHNSENTVVLLVTRFYEQMKIQLVSMGFKGRVIKLVDYNTYAEYSLSIDTINRKTERVRHGEEILYGLKKKFEGALLVFCPFNALGDVYFCMSYLPFFLQKKGIDKYSIIVPSAGCAEVAGLFGAEQISVLKQNELDAAVQAVIYLKDDGSFIAHQDRPYIINLHKALKVKKISLEEIYRVGIFGLEKDTIACKPFNWVDYGRLDEINDGRAAILSPYAKSVTTLPDGVWNTIVDNLKGKSYQVFTNVIGDEKTLPGTIPISPKLNEMKSVVERADLFIGIRSGLCDILRTANCRKIALYPDYYYGDTNWKSIDMYALEEFENIVAGEDYRWQMI